MSEPTPDPGARVVVRLPRAWVAAPATAALGAWVAFALLGPTSTLWFAFWLGIAVGASLFAVAAWGQRIEVGNARLRVGRLFWERRADLAALASLEVRTRSSGLTRSSSGAIVREASGRTVTVMLSTFPAAEVARLGAALRPYALREGVETNDAARAWVGGSADDVPAG